MCGECSYNMVVKNAAKKHMKALHETTLWGDIIMVSTCHISNIFDNTSDDGRPKLHQDAIRE